MTQAPAEDNGRLADPYAPWPTSAQIHDSIRGKIRAKLPPAVDSATGNPIEGDQK